MKAQKGFNVRAREAIKPLDGPWLDVFGKKLMIWPCD
jgi:hypothetical protein